MPLVSANARSFQTYRLRLNSAPPPPPARARDWRVAVEHDALALVAAGLAVEDVAARALVAQLDQLLDPRVPLLRGPLDALVGRPLAPLQRQERRRAGRRRRVVAEEGLEPLDEVAPRRVGHLDAAARRAHERVEREVLADRGVGRSALARVLDDLLDELGELVRLVALLDAPHRVPLVQLDRDLVRVGRPVDPLGHGDRCLDRRLHVGLRRVRIVKRPAKKRETVLLLDELGLDVVLLARVVEHREEEAHELLVAGVVLLGDEREVRLRAFRFVLESV